MIRKKQNTLIDRTIGSFIALACNSIGALYAVLFEQLVWFFILLGFGIYMLIRYFITHAQFVDNELPKWRPTLYTIDLGIRFLQAFTILAIGYFLYQTEYSRTTDTIATCCIIIGFGRLFLIWYNEERPFKKPDYLQVDE